MYAHPADAPYLRGERSVNSLKTLPYLRHPWYARYMVYLLANRVLRTPSIAALDDLADGEIIDVPGSPRVLHAPGHTAGHCALLLEDRSPHKAQPQRAREAEKKAQSPRRARS